MNSGFLLDTKVGFPEEWVIPLTDRLNNTFHGYYFSTFKVITFYNMNTDSSVERPNISLQKDLRHF